MHELILFKGERNGDRSSTFCNFLYVRGDPFFGWPRHEIVHLLARAMEFVGSGERSLFNSIQLKIF
jgi:hypothetical protein